jgi:hypothetical protein
MFTGIITAVGKISHVQPLEKGLRLTVEAPGLKLADVALGDSIAHGGVCLTVIAKKKNSYQVDVSRETLDCTVGLDAAGGEVNLEKAMRLSDFIGGHLVSGHVDGVGEVEKFEPVGESHELVIKAPKNAGEVHRAQGLDRGRWRLADHQPRVKGPPLLDQPDPAHRRSDDAEAPAPRRQGQSGNRPDRPLRRAHAVRRRGVKCAVFPPEFGLSP